MLRFEYEWLILLDTDDWLALRPNYSLSQLLIDYGKNNNGLIRFWWYDFHPACFDHGEDTSPLWKRFDMHSNRPRNSK